MPCWGSVYFVSKQGKSISPFDSWENAAYRLEDVMETIRSHGAGGNTIIIGPGIWDESAPLYFNHMNHSDTEIIGAGRSHTYITSPNHVVYGFAADRITIRELTLLANNEKSAVIKKGGCGDWLLSGIDMVSGMGHTAELIQLSGGLTEFGRCRFMHTMSQSGNRLALIDGVASVRFNYCLFAAAPHGYCIGYIMCAGNEVMFNNCNVMGFGSYGIVASTGLTSVTNTIVAGLGIQNTERKALQSEGTGRLAVVNSLIMGNMWDGDSDPIDSDDLYAVNNIEESCYPRFREHARRGYILPCIDDSTAFGYARELEGLLAEYRMQGTYFLTQSSWDSKNTDLLRDMVRQGTMEVGCHSYSHSSLLSSHALEIHYVGYDSEPSVEFDSDRIIRFRTAEGTDNYDIDTKHEEFNTVGEIARFDGTQSWNIKPVAHIRDTCLARSLSIQERRSVPCMLPLDMNQFYQDEIVNPKAWMTNTLIGGGGPVVDGQLGTVYRCKTFAPPFGPQTVESRQACMDAGYLLSRGRSPVGMGHARPKYGMALVDADLYSVRFYWGYGPLNGHEGQVRASARALAYGVVEAGLAVPVLAHNTGEMTLEEWAWCLDEWSRFGEALVVTSHQLLALEIRRPDGPWVDREDGWFTRNYGSDGDYRLAEDSPCINSGFDMGRFHAYDFTHVDQDLWGPWEIGLHVYEDDMLLELNASPGY
jgi:hypothetical protein